MPQTYDSVLNILNPNSQFNQINQVIQSKWKVFTIINNHVFACNEQKCAENNAIHNTHINSKHNNNNIINMFVFRLRIYDIEHNLFELSFSKPCSVCCNMLKAIRRKNKKIKIKWSTGNVHNLTTSYIDINKLTGSLPSSGTRNRYRHK